MLELNQRVQPYKNEQGGSMSFSWQMHQHDRHYRFHHSPAGLQHADRRAKVDRPWSEYPIGTVAHSSVGGYWTKTEQGWKANGGDTFPTPGGDVESVTLPETDKD
jgi:hypothetical protein